jgi:TonB family protein
MLMRSLAITLVALLLTSALIAQQTPTDTVEPIQKVAPVYPPIAMAAHISGTVELELVVGTNGHVKSVKPISKPDHGMAMLFGSASDCAKQWVYKPFLVDGVPTEKTLRTTIDFNLPGASRNDEKTADAYFPAAEKCRDAFRKPDTSAAVAPCSTAAEFAASFPDQTRFIERRAAYVYAASALFRDKQFQPAMLYAQKAVDVVLQGHDDGSGSNAAYALRAQCNAALGNLQGADADLATGENFLRAAIQGLSKDAPDMVKREYVPALKNELLLHARVLDALKNTASADEKRQEAAKL